MIKVKVNPTSTRPVILYVGSLIATMTWEEWDEIREEVEKARWDEKVGR